MRELKFLFFLFVRFEFLETKSLNCTYNYGITVGCFVNCGSIASTKTSTITVVSIPGIENSVISVIRGLLGAKKFSKWSMKFQVKSFQVELR